MKMADIHVGDTYVCDAGYRVKIALRVTAKGLPWRRRYSGSKPRAVGVKGVVEAVHSLGIQTHTYTSWEEKVGTEVELPSHEIESLYGPWKQEFDAELTDRRAASERKDKLAERLAVLGVEKARFAGLESPDRLRVELHADDMEALLAKTESAPFVEQA